MSKHARLLGWGLLTAWGLVSFTLDLALFPGPMPVSSGVTSLASVLGCLLLLAYARLRERRATGRMEDRQASTPHPHVRIWALALVTSLLSAANQATQWLGLPDIVPFLAQFAASLAYMGLMCLWFFAYAPHDPQTVEEQAVWSTALCALTYLVALLLPYGAAFALWVLLPLLSAACLSRPCRPSPEPPATKRQAMPAMTAGLDARPGIAASALGIVACSVALALPGDAAGIIAGGSQSLLPRVGNLGGLALAAVLILWYVTSARRISLPSLFRVLLPLAAVGLLLTAVPQTAVSAAGIALTTAGRWALYVFVWIYALERRHETPWESMRHFCLARIAFDAGGALSAAVTLAMPDPLRLLMPDGAPIGGTALLYVLFGALVALVVANALLPGVDWLCAGPHDQLVPEGQRKPGGTVAGDAAHGADQAEACRDDGAERALDVLIEQRAMRLSAQFALSERESQILTRLLRGYSTAAIRNELAIAKGTVDTYIQRIYRKCGVHARQQLVELAEGRTPSLLPGDTPNSTTTTGNAGRDASGEASRR